MYEDDGTVTIPPEVPLTTHDYTYHVVRANVYFQRYIKLQTEIEAIEAWALKYHPNRASAKFFLENQFVHRITGRTYPQMCKLRDQLMGVAQLSASMASLLKDTR